MSLEKGKKIKELFGLALEIPKEERLEFISKECLDDQEMYQELLSLINSHEEAESFLEKPVADLAAKLAKKEKDSLAGASKETFLEQLSGRVLEGKYLVEKQLGQGGMGAVYQAIHLGTKRPVAIKIIAPQFMARTEFVERFKREAEAAGRLSHPNVVNVTDFGVASFGPSKVAYLVMEHLKGLTLGALLKQKGKLPISFSVDILEQVCSAINEAHNQGIIHRDLKPDNIWLEPDGRGSYHVKVLDFGLAKLHSSTSQENSNQQNTSNLFSFSVSTSLTDHSLNFEKKDSAINSQINTLPNIKPVVSNEKTTAILQNSIGKATIETETRVTAGNIDPHSTPEWMTRVGMVLGTPLYMSPEQCNGSSLDKRTDIYSLGIIAYQMFTGQPPFRGEISEIIRSHSEKLPTPLQKHAKEIPSAIAEVVMTALLKNPSDRFPTAKAFAAALRANLEGEKPLISKSFDAYLKNFLPMIRISFPINFVFVITSCFISISLIQRSNFFLINWLQNIWWVFPLTLIFLTGEISKAAFALVSKDIEEAKQIIPTAILKKTFLHSTVILPTALKNYFLALLQVWKFIFPVFRLFTSYSLTSTIAVFEKKPETEIRNKSKNLVTKFYSIASPLNLRILLIKSFSFALFLLSFMTNGSLFESSSSEFWVYAPTTLLSVLLLPGIFMTLVNPVTDLAIALFYFKACEAKGENICQHKPILEVELIEKLKFSPKHKLRLSLLLIFSILISSFAYTLIIPPLEKVVLIDRPIIEKVPESENAWVEYNLAIQNLLDIPIDFMKPSKKPMQELIGQLSAQQLQNPAYANLEKAALGFVEFNENQTAYLNSHQNSIKHLLAGAKRSKSQYYNELPSFISPTPNFLQARALSLLAAAQVHRLQQQGAITEAMELALANYKMATDMGAENNGTLILGLISIVCRGIAARSLLTLIYSGLTTVEMNKEIVMQVTNQDLRMPNAYQLLAWEQQSNLLSMEEAFIKQNQQVMEEALYSNDSIITLLKAFPGLRVRFYKTYANLSRNHTKLIKNNLETWNFAAALKVNEAIGNNSRLENFEWYSLPSVLASTMFYIAMPNGVATMRSLYNNQCIGKALVVFAACDAYKKQTGEFPNTLEKAMSAVNLSIPVDLTSRKKVGYKLEQNIPTIWFAGVDGIDDGGQKVYETGYEYKPEPGKDLRFSYGQLPFYNPKN